MPKALKSNTKCRAGLTRQQARALAFIRQQIIDGVPPSYTELAKHLGLQARSGAVRILDALENRGWITRERGRARSIALVDEPPRLIAALPDDLRLEVVRLALKAKVDPNDVVVEACRDGVAAYWRRREAIEARALL
jgi:DNA-binding MarR family transcriptional regulator